MVAVAGVVADATAVVVVAAAVVAVATVVVAATVAAVAVAAAVVETAAAAVVETAAAVAVAVVETAAAVRTAVVAVVAVAAASAVELASAVSAATVPTSVATAAASAAAVAAVAVAVASAGQKHHRRSMLTWIPKCELSTTGTKGRLLRNPLLRDANFQFENKKVCVFLGNDAGLSCAIGAACSLPHGCGLGIPTPWDWAMMAPRSRLGAALRRVAHFDSSVFDQKKGTTKSWAE